MIQMKNGMACLVVAAAAATCIGEPAQVRLTGPFGERLDKMIRNHVTATDAVLLADRFHERTREGWWQTEFWGKYMHSAVPFWKYSGSAELKGKIDAGLETLLKAQEPCGYIGNYPEARRCGAGWDVWGMKYTMLGLIHYYDGTGDRRALDAARRLCDYLIGEVGPNGRRGVPLRHTGWYGGLASCSVLEPVVWLYRRTGEARYLDFATYIVGQLCDGKDGPQLVRQADVPVAERRFEVVPKAFEKNARVHLTKAYEMMSCYQGLLEYYEVTGDMSYLEAAVKTAESIRTTEVNLAGGAAAGEHWFRGADRQYRHISWQQETCVLTTWMRLCAKLLALTGDPKWGDELEKTFYNTYLGALNLNADKFASYSPLMGYRSVGHHHCKMHTDCCNANGPRGYLAVLSSYLLAEGDAVRVNLYMSGHSSAVLPKTGKKVAFQCYTLYPREGTVGLWYRSREPQTFAFRLRIPAFSAKTTVLVNGQPVAGTPKAGCYFEIARTWNEGDAVEVRFDLPVVMHRLHDYVAFTRGPVCLARDTRFGDGALDEEIRAEQIGPDDLAAFRLVRPPTTDMFLALAADLPAGIHTEDPDAGKFPFSIHFTDYASAGDTWQPGARYRVWLPELIPGRDYQ